MKKTLVKILENISIESGRFELLVYKTKEEMTEKSFRFLLLYFDGLNNKRDVYDHYAEDIENGISFSKHKAIDFYKSITGSENVFVPKNKDYVENDKTEWHTKFDISNN